ALVEGHDDVGAKADLGGNGRLRAEEMRRAVQVRTKGHAFLAYLAQIAEAENLVATGIGEDGARPGHKAMQSAQLAHLLHAGPQIEVVGVAEEDFDAQVLKDVLR